MQFVVVPTAQSFTEVASSVLPVEAVSFVKTFFVCVVLNAPVEISAVVLIAANAEANGQLAPSLFAIAIPSPDATL